MFFWICRNGQAEIHLYDLPLEVGKGVARNMLRNNSTQGQKIRLPLYRMNWFSTRFTIPSNLTACQCTERNVIYTSASIDITVKTPRIIRLNISHGRMACFAANFVKAWRNWTRTYTSKVWVKTIVMFCRNTILLKIIHAIANSSVVQTKLNSLFWVKLPSHAQV